MSMDKIAKNASLFNGDQLLKEILSYESRSYFAKILHSEAQQEVTKSCSLLKKLQKSMNIYLYIFRLIFS